ncbi:hypothetical protein F2Q70_00006460 [Brassica cretica]|uniref:Carboxypeptidase n=1 Tax=Brassica cretica TaxID=69181 RepID=A0A8S9IXR9_BRACR|nr:hypothetical protein F2Q70_00006460 [Brassica cretica]
MKKNALWLLLVLMLPAIACGRKPEKKVTVSSGRKEEYLVTGLPGQPPVNFRHYAGYVDLGPRQKQKALFYWFFEAQHNSSGRPLVLWLNGEANRLFLEAPVGVGFSYTNNSVDLGKLGDLVTAEDSLDFLINWFTKFPEFRSSEFYLTGESYAGHYVPQLAEVIYDRNGKMHHKYVLRSATAKRLSHQSQEFHVDSAWSHTIVSDDLHSNLHSTCRLEEEQTSNRIIQCLENIKAFMEAYNNIDIYSIYTPVCLSSDSSSTYHDMWDRFPAGYDPCTEGYTEKYFNRKDVQVALHANVTNLPYPYTPCRPVLGPGCSSVAYGAAQELGPFLVRTNGGNLTFNDFSWNKEANMLFLEAPVGVGFSYTNNSVDLGKLGDQVTAEDSLDFLINWFTKFPEFRSNDFYLTGESYAGHYVPQLAEVIYDRNKKVPIDSRINLKGFMIGNAAINEETDMAGLVDYAWSHAIVSDELHSNIHSTCRLGEEQTSNTTIQCYENIKAFMEAYNDIDIYSIYTPVCLSSDSSSSSSQRRPKLVVSPSLFTYHDMWDRFPAAGYDPCTEAYTENYFNRKDVQVALHANVTNLPYPYTPCSGVIRRWGEAPTTVFPIIQKLLTGGLRIWIYSGDTDGRVPVTSTRYSIKKMGSKVELPWRSWFHESQVAGWVETYAGGLTFATVRGAGHQVPVFAPAQSLTLFSHFLSSTPLPSKRF